MFTPADIPQVYKNTIEDLLMKILNSLPIPSGNAGEFLNGTFSYSVPSNGLDAGTGHGDMLFYDSHAAKWSVIPLTAFSYDEGSNALLFGNSAKIKIGEHIISRQDANYLAINNGINVLGSAFLTTAYIQNFLILSSNIKFINKALTNSIVFATRNTAGSEAVMDLDNVGNVTHPFATTIKTTTGNLNLQSYSGAQLNLQVGAQTVVMAYLNTLSPGTDAAVSLGENAYRFLNGYFSGTVNAATIQAPTGTFTVQAPAGHLNLKAASGFMITFSINSTYRFYIDNTNFYPANDNTMNIGTATYKLKDAYFAGTINTAAISGTGLIATTGNMKTQLLTALPNTTQLPDGQFMFYTSGGLLYLVFNQGGTIKKVQLT